MGQEATTRNIQNHTVLFTPIQTTSHTHGRSTKPMQTILYRKFFVGFAVASLLLLLSLMLLLHRFQFNSRYTYVVVVFSGSQ